MARRYISYVRVSTKRQGASGLGLEAQRDAVRRFVGDGQLVAEFEEVESGKRDDRPALEAALRECRLRNATLVIAKLDRLARSVSFVSRLMDNGVDFVAADMPSANKFTVHVMAALAEQERELISVRTKSALQMAKLRGVKLGGRRGEHRIEDHGSKARARSADVRMANAEAKKREFRVVAEAIRAAGHESLHAIARELNARSIAAPRGGLWSAGQVRRVIDTAQPATQERA